MPASDSSADPAVDQTAALETGPLETPAIQTTAMQTEASTIIAEASARDPWTTRARPAFLYMMYLMILCSLPMGLLSAISPATANAIAMGMRSYLTALPEPLYTLFATGYLGYTAARQWGKIAGSDK